MIIRIKKGTPTERLKDALAEVRDVPSFPHCLDPKLTYERVFWKVGGWFISDDEAEAHGWTETLRAEGGEE